MQRPYLMRSGYKQTHKAVERNLDKDDVTKRYPICHKRSSSKEKQLAVVQHIEKEDKLGERIVPPGQFRKATFINKSYLNTQKQDFGQ